MNNSIPAVAGGPEGSAEKEQLSSPAISLDKPANEFPKLTGFMSTFANSGQVVAPYASKESYSHLVRGLLDVVSLDRGRVSCVLTVKPPVVNIYGGLHGGVVAAVAELMSIACARTVVTEDKELFLGELSMSYLSAAPSNAELIVDASLIRSGRNVTATSVEFKLKKTGKLAYLARATFYNMPVAKL